MGRKEAKSADLWNRKNIRQRRRTLVYMAGLCPRFKEWGRVNWDIPGVRIPRSARAIRIQKLAEHAELVRLASEYAAFFRLIQEAVGPTETTASSASTSLALSSRD